jgi:hypothetical protein
LAYGTLILSDPVWQQQGYYPSRHYGTLILPDPLCIFFHLKMQGEKQNEKHEKSKRRNRPEKYSRLCLSVSVCLLALLCQHVAVFCAVDVRDCVRACVLAVGTLKSRSPTVLEFSCEQTDLKILRRKKIFDQVCGKVYVRLGFVPPKWKNK